MRVTDAHREQLAAEGILVAGTEGWLEFTNAAGNPYASFDTDDEVLHATCQLAFRAFPEDADPTAFVEECLAEARAAFEQLDLPDWEAAGFELLDIEDMSADPSVVFIFAALARPCATPDELVEAARFAAEHESATPALVLGGD
jgi:hypothetical protein